MCRPGFVPPGPSESQVQRAHLDPSTSTAGQEAEPGESLEAHRTASLIHDTVSDRVEGKSQHSRLSSDLSTHAVSPMHLHSFIDTGEHKGKKPSSYKGLRSQMAPVLTGNVSS